MSATSITLPANRPPTAKSSGLAALPIDPSHTPLLGDVDFLLSVRLCSSAYHVAESNSIGSLQMPAVGIVAMSCDIRNWL
jgi:hypothetical protein